MVDVEKEMHAFQNVDIKEEPKVNKGFENPNESLNMNTNEVVGVSLVDKIGTKNNKER